MAKPNTHWLSYLIAASIVAARRVSRARLGGEVVELPIRLEKPEPGTVIDLVLEQPVECSSPSSKLFLRLDLDVEALVIANGEEVHGYDWFHRLVPLPSHVDSLSIVLGGGRVDSYGIAIERSIPAELRSAEILEIDWRVARLGIALRYLVELVESVDDEELRGRIASLVDDVVRRIAPLSLEPEAMVRAVEVYREFNPLQGLIATPSIDVFRGAAGEVHGYRRVDREELGRACEEAYEELLEGLEMLSHEFGKRGSVLPVAQSHLDYLWLWSRKSFEIKLGKTFATLLSIAEQNPGLLVGFTSSYYVEELAKLYPKLFDKLRRCVERGQCVAMGGTWIEFDANLSDGEALARQFLYGQRTLVKLFGKRSRVLYLPDTFGFPPTLPEIARVAGIELFVDRKLSWNDTNRFPYMYFRWVSPSGEELVSIYAGHCYTRSLHPSKVLAAWRENSEKQLVNEVVLLFGYGDGGGGPSIEQLVELEVMSRAPLLPRVSRRSVEKLIEELKNVSSELPTWFGELYLENHRGVYSSGIELKNSVDHVVTLLKTIDALRTYLRIVGIDEPPRIGERVEGCWKEILKSYFHDTISATLSYPAYRDALEEIENVEKRARETLSELASILGSRLSPGLYIFNPVPWRRIALVRIRGLDGAPCVDGKPVPYQRLGNEVVVQIELPALGIVKLDRCEDSEGFAGMELDVRSDGVYARVGDASFFIEKSGVVEVSLDGFGKLVDRGNDVRVFVDVPREWDAWNVDPDYSLRELSVSHEGFNIVSEGPLLTCVEVSHRVAESKIHQLICIDAVEKAVRFKSVVKWRERHTMAKAFFEHSLVSNEAIIGAPLGFFKRSLYASTSWERAKYEAWIGRWVAVSQSDAGFALVVLKGGRGLSLEPRRLGYTMFRLPVHPNPLIDSEGFEVEYILIPFRGPWIEAGLPRRAAELVLEPVQIRGASDGGAEPPLGVDVLSVGKGIAVEGVKPCEDGGKCVVVHGFEMRGARTPLELSVLGSKSVRVSMCSWDEMVCTPVELGRRLRPQQVICLKVDL